jgi:hypothetical protein
MRKAKINPGWERGGETCEVRFLLQYFLGTRVQSILQLVQSGAPTHPYYNRNWA